MFKMYLNLLDTSEWAIPREKYQILEMSGKLKWIPI